MICLRVKLSLDGSFPRAFQAFVLRRRKDGLCRRPKGQARDGSKGLGQDGSEETQRSKQLIIQKYVRDRLRLCSGLSTCSMPASQALISTAVRTSASCCRPSYPRDCTETLSFLSSLVHGPSSFFCIHLKGNAEMRPRNGASSRGTIGG